MPAADTTVVRVASPAARSAPTATDTWFVAGATETVTAGAYEVRSMGEFDTELGDGSTIRPYLELFFRLGGAKAIISPAANAAAVPAALTEFTEEHGPGQISAPGLTTDAVYEALTAHAAANNRFAILDGPNTATVADIITAADVDNGKYGEMWVPWVDTRSASDLPYSPVAAAMYARNDNNGIGRGQPPAGEDYGIVGEPVIGLSQAAWSKDDRDDLDDAGVSIAKIYRGAVAQWSNKTLDTTGDSRFAQSSQMRVLMALEALFKAAGQRYEHRRIDRQRKLIGSFGLALDGICKRAGDDLWSYFVNVGEAVNTDATIAAQELHADIELVTSPSVGPVSIRLIHNLLAQS